MPNNLSTLFTALQERADACPSGEEILRECLTVAAVLLDKNKKYGDSALKPRRIFSRASPVVGIEVRLDDKLSRVENRADGNDDEDPELDMMGYVVLLRIARRQAAAADAAERAP
jgi:hypothetical protein